MGCLLREFELRAFEFEDAGIVAADEHAIFFDEDGGGVQPCAIRSVELVGSLAISVFVEAQQTIVQGHPHFTGVAQRLRRRLGWV